MQRKCSQNSSAELPYKDAPPFQLQYLQCSCLFRFLSNTLFTEHAWNRSTSWQANSTVNLKVHMFRVPWILSCLLQQLPVMARKCMKLVTLLQCHHFSLMLMFHFYFHNLHLAFSDNEIRLVMNMFLLWLCVVVMWLLFVIVVIVIITVDDEMFCFYFVIAWFKFSVSSRIENCNWYKTPRNSFSK